MINYNSKKEISKLLEDFGIAPLKSRGQNFLIDKNIREFIVNLADISKSTTVWEIGPGIGQLSSLLFNKTDNLTLFELDKGFISIINQNLNFSNIIEGDFLKTYKNFQKPNLIFGNLPYNISSRIIVNLIEDDFDNMIFVIQKELSQRLSAKPRKKNYSLLSVIFQSKADIEIIKEIPPSCFYPVPKVKSVIVKIKKHNNYTIDNFNIFKDIIKTSFLQRRKKLFGNLSKKYSKDILSNFFSKNNISTDIRAEELDLQYYYQLYCQLNKN